MAQTDQGSDVLDLSRLIHESRRGGTGALNEICSRLRPRLVEYCRRQIHEQLRAKITESDLVQESLLAVSERFDTFRGQTAAELIGWVSVILDHKNLEIQRRYFDIDKRDVFREQPLASENTSQFGMIPAAATATPLEVMVSAEEALRVQLLIARLPEHYQKVVKLRHMEELSFPEIASTLDWTEPKVKNIYVRAMNLLEQGMKSK